MFFHRGEDCENQTGEYHAEPKKLYTNTKSYIYFFECKLCFTTENKSIGNKLRFSYYYYSNEFIFHFSRYLSLLLIIIFMSIVVKYIQYIHNLLKNSFRDIT